MRFRCVLNDILRQAKLDKLCQAKLDKLLILLRKLTQEASAPIFSVLRQAPPLPNSARGIAGPGFPSLPKQNPGPPPLRIVAAHCAAVRNPRPHKKCEADELMMKQMIEMPRSPPLR